MHMRYWVWSRQQHQARSRSGTGGCPCSSTLTSALTCVPMTLSRLSAKCPKTCRCGLLPSCICTRTVSCANDCWCRALEAKPWRVMQGDERSLARCRRFYFHLYSCEIGCISCIVLQGGCYCFCCLVYLALTVLALSNMWTWLQSLKMAVFVQLCTGTPSLNIQDMMGLTKRMIHDVCMWYAGRQQKECHRCSSRGCAAVQDCLRAC